MCHSYWMGNSKKEPGAVLGPAEVSALSRGSTAKEAMSVHAQEPAQPRTVHTSGHLWLRTQLWPMPAWALHQAVLVGTPATGPRGGQKHQAMLQGTRPLAPSGGQGATVLLHPASPNPTNICCLKAKSESRAAAKG